MLTGYGPILRKLAVFLTAILLLAIARQANADSFAGLSMFGFPATGSGWSGISGVTSGNGGLSASAASYSPANQFTGYFGAGLNGIQIGMGFTYPMATHDASTVAYARDVAFESTLGDDSIAFPEINVDTSSALSSFPTIDSANSDVKYRESVQLMLSTESDTMPVTTGFSFPGYFSNWL
jgi:maltoporin